MPRQVGIEHHPLPLRPRPQLRRERAEHGWQSKHEHATVRIGIERRTAELNLIREAVHSASDVAGERLGGHVERGHHIHLDVAVSTEVQRERRRRQRFSE